jgi:hypothetical protein
MKRSPNLTVMATSDMPLGKGRKGSEPPRKRYKKAPIESRLSVDVSTTPTQLPSHESLRSWPS